MSLARAKFLTITILLIQMGQQICSRKIYAYFEELDCSSYNADYIETLKCWLVPDHKGQLMMNAVLKLKHDFNNINNKFRLVVERNNKNLTFISLNVDICNSLGAAHRNPVLRLVAEEVRRISNLPLECPLKRGIEYVIKNFTINSKYIPPFAPRLKWFSISEFYMNSAKERAFLYTNSGRVDHLNPKKVPASKY